MVFFSALEGIIYPIVNDYSLSRCKNHRNKFCFPQFFYFLFLHTHDMNSTYDNILKEHNNLSAMLDFVSENI